MLVRPPKQFHQDFALDDSDEEEPLLLTPEAVGEKPAWATGLCKEGLFMNNGEGIGDFFF